MAALLLALMSVTAAQRPTGVAANANKPDAMTMEHASGDLRIPAIAGIADVSVVLFGMGVSARLRKTPVLA